MRRHRRKSSLPDVELNLAAMLDMAFQLLTFFILTFKPAPREGQVLLNLPIAGPVTVAKTSPAASLTPSVGNPSDALRGFRTLVITLGANDSGRLGWIAIAGEPLPPERTLRKFSARLAELLNDPESPFDQVVIRVAPGLHYGELMRVIEVCTRQTVGGDPRTKLRRLSFVAL